MIIDIDDALPGEMRRRLVIVKQVEYAMAKFKNKTLAAKFLGVSSRAFRNWCHRYEELHVFRRYNSWLSQESDRKGYLDMLKRYPIE